MLINYRTGISAFGRCAPLPVIAMLLAACGDPAPGEGVEEPPTKGPEPEVVEPSEAVHSPDIAKTDLGTMEEAEIGKIVSENSRCTFSYSAEGKPIFAASVGGEGPSGVAKIHGKLVPLKSSDAQDFNALKQGGRFQSDGLIVEVKEVRAGDEGSTSEGHGAEANLHFALKEEGHSVDYHGWYRCRSQEVAQKSR